MNCEDFNEVVLDIARDKLLAANVRAAALEHASGCASCSFKLGDEERLSKQLRGLAEAMQSLSATPEISSVVIATLRGQPRIISFRARRRRQKWAAAAAAIVLLAIGLASQFRNALLTFNRSGVDLPQQNQIKSPQPQITGADVPDVPLKPSHNSTKHTKPMLGRSQTSRLSNPTVARAMTPSARMKAEIATNFFQVGDTSASSLADGGQLVRVELPRSVLMSFGLPMNTDRTSERVKADVLVGSDGIARAIRFVR